MALGLAGSLVFDAVSLPHASASSPKPENHQPKRSSRSLIQHSPSAIDEFTIGKRVTQLTGTTREIHALVATLPGPNLPENRATEATPTYADPYEEMLTRLQHATSLVSDITAILTALPNKVVAPAPPLAHSALPEARPLPALPETQSRPATTDATAPDAAPETTTIEINKRGTAASPLSAMTLTRLGVLLLGALFAVGLIKYLPRLFRSKNGAPKSPTPTRKSIEPPPLNDHALELADIMASMGLTDGAAHALVEHIRKNPKQALSYWLKLLAVYRQAGKQTEFEQTAELMRTNYNVQPGAWEGNGGLNLGPESLEHYPHIAAQLKKLWPRPECSDYLLSLLGDNRDGRREGFPLPVVEEIVLLLAMLRTGNDG